MIGIIDRDYSVAGLAEVTGVSKNTIRAYTNLEFDPLPSIAHGRRGLMIHWSDWLEWSTRRLGLCGDLRGIGINEE